MPSGQIWQPEKSLVERLSDILTVTTLCTDITTDLLQYQYILISHSLLYNFLWNSIVCHLYSNLRLQIYWIDLSYYTEPQSKITCYIESHRIDITLHRINISIWLFITKKTLQMIFLKMNIFLKTDLWRAVQYDLQLWHL